MCCVEAHQRHHRKRLRCLLQFLRPRMFRAWWKSGPYTWHDTWVWWFRGVKFQLMAHPFHGWLITPAQPWVKNGEKYVYWSVFQLNLLNVDVNSPAPLRQYATFSWWRHKTLKNVSFEEWGNSILNEGRQHNWLHYSGWNGGSTWVPKVFVRISERKKVKTRHHIIHNPLLNTEQIWSKYLFSRKQYFILVCAEQKHKFPKLNFRYRNSISIRIPRESTQGNCVQSDESFTLFSFFTIKCLRDSHGEVYNFNGRNFYVGDEITFSH